jgi:hypothetical protein
MLNTLFGSEPEPADKAPADTSAPPPGLGTPQEEASAGALLTGGNKSANASTSSLNALGFVTAGDKVQEPLPGEDAPASASEHDSTADKEKGGAASADEAAQSSLLVRSHGASEAAAAQVNPVMAHMQQIWSQPLGDETPRSPRTFRPPEQGQGSAQQSMQEADAALSPRNAASDLQGLLDRGMQLPTAQIAQQGGDGFLEKGSEERAMSIMRQLLNGRARDSGDLASLLDAAGSAQDQVARLRALSLAAGGGNGQGVPLRQDSSPTLAQGYSAERAQTEGQYAKMLYEQALAAGVQRPNPAGWAVERGAATDPLARGRDDVGGAPTASLQLLQQLQYGERSLSGSLVHGGQAPPQAASAPVAQEGLGPPLQAGLEHRDALIRRQQAQV